MHIQLVKGRTSLTIKNNIHKLREYIFLFYVLLLFK